jgi:hypothetical protein
MKRKPNERLCEYEETLKDDLYWYFSRTNKIEVTKYICDGTEETEIVERRYDNIWKDIEAVANDIMQGHIIGYDIYKA